ncbi:MAG: M23 family metallopeptidase [Bacteroidales bacterium]|jgi:murein DD-endopeptidase MepM/ murein hydrolase activator NlpD|nr:M23 family metallopeptidase [Bacteroidales bacterium]
MNCILACLIAVSLQSNVYLPFDPGSRRDVSKIRLTEIGEFGLKRKARPTVPAHYHTGIDIRRPGGNYDAEPVFAMAAGKVISKRTDGPYANLIIEHLIDRVKVWTLYEHIAGILVNAGEIVTPSTPIARFMNRDELNRYGWQFDHFHFEVLRVQPLKLQPTAKNPERFFNAYSLVCYNLDDLYRYYYSPVKFLESH